jgi:hypothetical protein
MCIFLKAISGFFVHPKYEMHMSVYFYECFLPPLCYYFSRVDRHGILYFKPIIRHNRKIMNMDVRPGGG